MNSLFGMKDLEQVSLKTTSNIEIDGVPFESNEIIAFFDRIQIANFAENKLQKNTNGGFDNRPHVFWEDTQQIDLHFTQGVLSKTQFALLSNARLLNSRDSFVIISQREELESDEEGKIILQHEPYSELFIYNRNNHNKLQYGKENNIITIAIPCTDVIVDYNYKYHNKVSQLSLGHRLIEGFLRLEGRTRIKDDITGQEKTAIIVIPKLKLMSQLVLTLGANATPLIGNFNAIAVPNGAKGDKTVMEFYFLEDDIDSDF